MLTHYTKMVNIFNTIPAKHQHVKVVTATNPKHHVSKYSLLAPVVTCVALALLFLLGILSAKKQVQDVKCGDIHTLVIPIFTVIISIYTCFNSCMLSATKTIQTSTCQTLLGMLGFYFALFYTYWHYYTYTYCNLKKIFLQKNVAIEYE